MNNNENDKNKNPKKHFWIHDNEVEFVTYSPTSRNKPKDIDHYNHGIFLSKGMNNIEKTHLKSSHPLKDKLMIFKIELPEEDIVDKRGDYENLFLKNNLKVNSIKKSNVAVVSTTPAHFKSLSKKLNSYTSRKGASYNFFQNIKSISSFDSDEKLSTNLLENTESIQDVQITLLPNLEKEEYTELIEYIYQNILKEHGQIIENVILQNNTPIIRALLPSSGLKTFSDQEIVLGIKKTPFFGTKQEGGGQNEIDLTDVAVHFPDDPKNLPVICILDDGVFLPESMKDCIAGRYVSPDLKYPPTCEHGTKVASRAIFGDDIDKQVQQKKLIPKVRIIDAAINDGRSGVGESTLINRIRSAVESIKEQAQIFCLSMNAEEQISEDSVGNLAYVLDSLTKEYEEDNIQFVVPTGNHKLWTYYTEFADIIDDDSSRIAAPSESFHALTIGSISRDEHQYSISKKLEISPFSRIGFGFGGCNKPDLVYPGGNVYINNNKGYISANSAAYVINNQGKLCQDFGTSFAAPIGAQELALLREQVPYKNIRIAKSLLLHHADTPHIQLYESSKETRELHSRMYGKGMGNYDSARSSFRSRATYLREGKMSRLTKQRVRFYMPSTIASYSNTRQPVIKVSITCVTFSKVDQSKGGEYLRSYIDASLHKINSNNNSTTDNPPGKEGRQPWHHVHHFSQVISSFNPGDWEIWLHLFTKPELSNEEEIPYILLVSIEDLTNNDVDIHGGISLETESRFEILNEVEIEANELNLDNGNY